MQLISAIYCLTLFKSLLDQPLAADLSLVMFIFAFLFLRVTAVMLNWTKVEQSQHLRYQHNMCCTHSATRGLKYMCYDCNRWKIGARTQGLSLTARTLYHWATKPPGHITNNSSPETYPGYMLSYVLFGHAFEHFSVSVNVILFQMLISQ